MATRFEVCRAVRRALRRGLVFVGLFALFDPPAAAVAQVRASVATLAFDPGLAELLPEHRAVLDDLLRRYPPAGYIYSFEGDHDPSRYFKVTPKASERLSERLGETRWQNVAQYLGVSPLGFVRTTGRAEVRVYVEPRSKVLEDSLATLRREIDALRQAIGAQSPGTALPPSTAPRAFAPAETVLAVARLEELFERSDKWVDRQWWESQGGIELGILRVTPERTGHRTGATLRIANGTPSYQPLEITTRLDLFRIGVERFGITPALRWYDWGIRAHYGDDRDARATFLNRADPNYLIGFDVDARPWSGAWARLEYAGFGSRVHAAHRQLISYDHYDVRFDQRLVPRLHLELQAVYDERFKKSLAYSGAWLAYVWPLRLGEFSMSLGFVEELDALAASSPTRSREDLISTVSLGFAWRRARR